MFQIACKVMHRDRDFVFANAIPSKVPSISKEITIGNPKNLCIETNISVEINIATFAPKFFSKIERNNPRQTGSSLSAGSKDSSNILNTESDNGCRFGNSN